MNMMIREYETTTMLSTPPCSSPDPTWTFGWEDWLSRDDAQVGIYVEDKTRGGSITDKKVETLRDLISNVKIFMTDEKGSCLPLPPSLVGQSWVQS